jgi:hypothetical protein
MRTHAECPQSWWEFSFHAAVIEPNIHHNAREPLPHGPNKTNELLVACEESFESSKAAESAKAEEQLDVDGKQEEGFIAYADADWASDHISRKSVTGYIIKLAGGAVSWVSRKQKTVALSSTEAEYMCLSDTTRQIVWIESLFKELNFDISNVALCGDNQGAIFLASNPAQEHRSKHIDIRYHYIRECVEGKKVILHYVPTMEQIADIMTKCLSYDKF